MVWTGISIALVFAIAVTAALLRKRPLANELGAVSDRWIAQHRSVPRDESLRLESLQVPRYSKITAATTGRICPARADLIRRD
ncbi:MAG: hypothetical protein EHM55_21445 [Acidobacteria bacterium]|nr:MAG: hypothetical protein EHM55_21445 [Acidobacteriota bacterium]